MKKIKRIYEICESNHALLTSKMATGLGVTPVELNRYVKQGNLEKLGRGVYRTAHYAPSENDFYAISVAIVDDEAFLYGESVLAMLKMTPTSPKKIYVGTTRRVRKEIPENIEVVKTKIDEDVDYFDGIKIQTPRAAILSCKGKVMPARLLQATETAFKEGFLTKEEKTSLLRELEIA